MPAITIVTPTYNRWDLLARATRSVQAQTYTDYEHIIVDDHSSDRTEQMIAQIDDPRIVYRRLDRRSGSNAARNHGWRCARSPLVTFLDSDDEYRPNRLRDTIARFEAAADLQLAISSFATVRVGQTIGNVNPARRLDPRELRMAVAAQVLFMATSAITLRRDLLVEVGGFDEALPRFQDGDLLLRIGRRHGAELLPGIDWIKHDHAQSITRSEKAVPAYAALSRRNRSYAEEFPQMLCYMVARSVLADVIGLRPDAAWNSFRASRSPPLSYSAADLLKGYFEGKRLRRAMKAAIKAS